MQVKAATLRHRQLTQEIFNIGDEVASFIENLAEAVADWDGELVEDCLAELEEIIEDARRDSRTVATELAGLHQALTSGLASGKVSMAAPEPAFVAPPVVMDAEGLRERFPIQKSPVIVGELTQALQARTDLIGQYLAHVVEWELAETEKAARNAAGPSLPQLYARTHRLVLGAAEAWLAAVAEEHPGYTRSMRGSNPPEFLGERARIDAVVQRVKAKRSGAAHVS